MVMAVSSYSPMHSLPILCVYLTLHRIFILSIFQVTDSIYDLVGAETPPKVKMQNVEQVFSCMDSNRDGIITKEEFVKYCSDTHHVSRNLAVLP